MYKKYIPPPGILNELFFVLFASLLFHHSVTSFFCLLD